VWEGPEEGGETKRFQSRGIKGAFGGRTHGKEKRLSAGRSKERAGVENPVKKILSSHGGLATF